MLGNLKDRLEDYGQSFESFFALFLKIFSSVVVHVVNDFFPALGFLHNYCYLEKSLKLMHFFSNIQALQYP